MTSLWLLLAVVAEVPDAAALPDAASVVAAVDGAAADAEMPDAAPLVAADGHVEKAAPAPGQLRGRVLVKGSRVPVLGARVVASGAAGPVASSEADDDGRFELPLPCGSDRARLATSPCFSVKSSSAVNTRLPPIRSARTPKGRRRSDPERIAMAVSHANWTLSRCSCWDN